jgi:hypothetical protein
MEPKQEKQCEECGSAFPREPGRSDKAWSKRKYCSKGCATKARWRDAGFKRDSTPIEERFWLYVDKDKRESCWEWKGALDGHGYGQISTGKHRSPIKAHQLSWVIHFGIDSTGMDVCHACDNRRCVNPYHLMLGTRMANMIDASKKGQLNRRKNSG